MKKMLKSSFLLAVLCFTVPVYADGDMSTGNKNCTQNCGGFYEGTTIGSTNSEIIKQEESTFEEIYSWISEKFSELVD